MNNLLCLIKGHSINVAGKGYVICPDCGVAFCWHRNGLETSTPPRFRWRYGKWAVCTHGEGCINRRLHKNRRDNIWYRLEDMKKEVANGIRYA